MDSRMYAAKAYLNQVYRLEQRINSKLEQVMRLRSMSKRMTVSYGAEPVSRTRNVSSMEDAILKIMMVEREIDQTIDAMLAQRKEIEQTIQLITDPDSRTLLELRYLAFKDWDEIAVNFRCSISYAHRLHRRALLLIDAVLAAKEAG